MLSIIERIVSFGPRWTGMEGDRRTVDFIADELRASGRSVDLEEIRVRPAFHLTHAIHSLLAVGGTLLSTSIPPLGVLVLLLVGASTYGDLTGRFYTVRFLMPRRLTRNVTSAQPRPGAVARVILVAHHDAARTGLIWERRRKRPPRRRPRRLLASLAGPLDILFWTVMAALVAALVSLVVDDSGVLTAVQFAIAVVLLTYVMLLIDVAISDVSPGASDNASGVATVMEVGRRLQGAAPRGVETWLVLTAAKEGLALGMRAWLREHRADLDPRNTFFVNVDTVGQGELHHVTADGYALAYRSDARLATLCKQLGSQPYVWRVGTDATQAAMAGYASITICGLDAYGRPPEFHRTTDTPDLIDPDALTRAADLVEGLVRRIDEVMAPREPAPAEQGPG